MPSLSSSSKSIKEKRDDLVKVLKVEGWYQNPRYPSGYGYDFLMSPKGNYALTVKAQVITLHDSNRGFCKVLSMKINEVRLKSDGLECGILKMYFKD